MSAILALFFIYFFMGMMDEIEKLMCATGNSVNYRIVNLGGTSLYVEGLKNVVSFGETEMQFQLKNKLLVVAGANLKVKYLDKTTCVLLGSIEKVEVK